MSNEGTADLCRWLRENSSGTYRNAATAAVVIESQHAELIERQSVIDRLTRELAEAKARALPDGWVAVPEALSTKMIDAMRSDGWPWLSLPECHSIYRAMIDARSELPKESPDVK